MLYELSPVYFVLGLSGRPTLETYYAYKQEGTFMKAKNMVSL